MRCFFALFLAGLLGATAAQADLLPPGGGVFGNNFVVKNYGVARTVTHGGNFLAVSGDLGSLKLTLSQPNNDIGNNCIKMAMLSQANKGTFSVAHPKVGVNVDVTKTGGCVLTDAVNP